MNFVHRKRKEDIGVSPFEIRSRAASEKTEMIISVKCLNRSSFEEKEIHTVEEISDFKNIDALCWINITGLGNEEKMIKLSDILNIPTNIISDVMDPSLRPQVEDFDNGLFVTIKLLKHVDGTNTNYS